MRRLLTTAVVLTIAFSLAPSSEAEAGRRGMRANRSSRPLFQRFQQRSNGNMFSNLMELERRKNAWLRSTFLGR